MSDEEPIKRLLDELKIGWGAIDYMRDDGFADVLLYPQHAASAGGKLAENAALRASLRELIPLAEQFDGMLGRELSGLTFEERAAISRAKALLGGQDGH